MKDLQCPRYKSAFKQATAVLVSKSVPSSHMRGPRMAAKWLPVRRHHSISVSYTLVLASAFGTSRDVASESTTDVEPEMAGAKVMPIFEKILPSLPVFFSCSKSGGGVCCSCCSRLYCSCNALCFFSSSWWRISNCSWRRWGICAGRCCNPSCELMDSQLDEVDGDGCWRSFSATMRELCKWTAKPLLADPKEPLRVGLRRGAGAIGLVGDARGDLELVRGGGGGGTRLAARSPRRSGTGGLASAGKECRRRSVAVLPPLALPVTPLWPEPPTSTLPVVCSSSSRESNVLAAYALHSAPTPLQPRDPAAETLPEHAIWVPSPSFWKIQTVFVQMARNGPVCTFLSERGTASYCSSAPLDDLPVSLFQCIIDVLFGCRREYCRRIFLGLLFDRIITFFLFFFYFQFVKRLNFQHFLL